MSMLPPLVLDPVLVPKPWGGHRLASFDRSADPSVAVGESWEVADLPAEATTVDDPVSRVVGGPFDGWTLGELLEHDRDGLLGNAEPSTAGRFPLLVKVLDAAETLSVQVHPPRSLAPDQYKTETWVVLDAEEGAELLLGVRDGVALDDVREAVGTAQLVDLLQRVPARVGDVVHVPAGTVHALGAGVLVAEVQTPSDTTHRLWDWPDERDGGRQLHVQEGLEAIAAGWEHNVALEVDAGHDGRLVTTDAYCLDRWTLEAGEVLPASTTTGAPRVCIVLEGALRWTDEDAGGERRRARTECMLLPAGSDVEVVATDGGTRVLAAVPT